MTAKQEIQERAKEFPEGKTLGVATFKLQSVLQNISIAAEQVNQKLIPLCQQFDIEVSTELLQAVMTDPKAVEKLFVEKINNYIEKTGSTGNLIRSSMLDASKPMQRQLEKVVQYLQSYDSQLGHANFMVCGRGVSIFPRIEIVSGRAVVSTAGKQELLKLFTYQIENDRQQAAYDLLQRMAEDANTLMEMRNESPNLMPEFTPDGYYLEAGANGLIQVNVSVINLF